MLVGASVDSSVKCGQICPRDGASLSHWTPALYPAGRFQQCLRCWVVFWWDGPSILGEKDPARKLSVSNDLVPVTDAQCIELRRI